MQWRRRSRSELAQTRFGRVRMAVSGVWDVLTWAFLLVLVIVVVTRVIGGSAPSVLQPLQAILPYLFIPAWIILLAAAGTKRWAQVVAAILLCITHWFSVAPATRTATKPFWAAKASTFTIATANLYREAKDPTVTLNTLFQTNADIIVMVELTPSVAKLLADPAVKAQYPFQVTKPNSGPGGGGVISKYPFDDTQYWGIEKLPAVRVVLPTGEGVRVVAAHPLAPLNSRDAGKWDADLKEFRRRSDDLSVDEPLVITGDFNATRWQPPFGHLLAGPIRDAHETVGKGLSMSWPMHAWIPPVVRLDHALYNERLHPVTVTDINDASSDHRPFVVKFAVQAHT
jgi:endonuclease/exonuclease/phosphatase (EEP) superfamily protein YafD